MKIGSYKINSSVLLASILSVLGGIANLASNGAVIDFITSAVGFFTDNPEFFKPYISEKVYQILLILLPALIGILRVTNVKYKPPIQKLSDHRHPKKGA